MTENDDVSHHMSGTKKCETRHTEKHRGLMYSEQQRRSFKTGMDEDEDKSSRG